MKKQVSNAMCKYSKVHTEGYLDQMLHLDLIIIM